MAAGRLRHRGKAGQVRKSPPFRDDHAEVERSPRRRRSRTTNRLRAPKSDGPLPCLPAPPFWEAWMDSPMEPRRIGRSTLNVVVASPLFVTAPLWRRWHQRWGATDEEVR